MTTPPIDLEAEKQEILRRYRGIAARGEVEQVPGGPAGHPQGV